MYLFVILDKPNYYNFDIFFFLKKNISIFNLIFKIKYFELRRNKHYLNFLII